MKRLTLVGFACGCLLTLGLAALGLLFGCATSSPSGDGLFNGGPVAATQAIYHCGRLTPEGLTWLAAHGVTNVLKLDTWEEDPADQVAMARGMNVLAVPISDLEQLTGEHLDVLLPLALRQIKPGTVIHCYYGRNRTMTLCGMYWVSVMGWSMAQAETNMLAYGWGDSLPGLKDAFYQRRGW